MNPAEQEVLKLVRKGLKGFRMPVLRIPKDGKCTVLDVASIDCEPKIKGDTWEQVLEQIKPLVIK